MNQGFITTLLENDRKSAWIYVGLALLSILVISLAIGLDKPVYMAIPLLIIGGTVLFFFPRWVFILLCFALPLSHELKLPGIGFNMSLPGELLVAVISIGAFYALLFNSRETSHLLKHPITWLILLYWVATAISTITSTMPTVSLKAFVLLTCYLLVFYFWMHRMMLKENIPALSPYIWHSFLLFGLAVYATYLHSGYSFDKKVAGFVVKPFYSDHTIYGACLAFMLPITFGLFYYSRKLQLRYPFRIFWLVCTLAFLVAVFFSHSRASWMSIIAALMFYFVLQLKIQFRSLMITLVSLVAIFLLLQDTLAPALFKNRNDSKAKGANLEEQLKSVTNMKKDVSNAERVNRWMCALRMFANRPLNGYGAGTYQYQYLPFQHSSEMTIISVTSAKVKHLQGFGGTAHSEYLLALSETGILGGVALFLLIFVTIRTGMNTYYTAVNSEIAIPTLLITLSMVTYFVHGFFNNFLNTDKVGFLFWLGCSMLILLEWKNNRLIQKTISS